jgi:hypothetical protein
VPAGRIIFDVAKRLGQQSPLRTRLESLANFVDQGDGYWDFAT